MKRVEINETLFKCLIDGVKRCVATDASRPILQYIQIKVKTDTITAYALDGYRAGRVEIKNVCPIDEEFTCYIKPLTVKVSKRGTNLVFIEQSDEKTFVEVVTEYGVLRYGFTTPQDKFIDVEKIYIANRSHDREIAMNPRFVIDALKNFSGMQKVYGGAKYAIFESNESKTNPIIIRTKNDEVINEQLILPVYILEDKE